MKILVSDKLSTRGEEILKQSGLKVDVKTVRTTLKKTLGEEDVPENKFKASLTYPDVSLLRTL